MIFHFSGPKSKYTGGGIALYPTINNTDRVASDSYSAVRMTGFPKKSIWKFAASKAANNKNEGLKEKR